MHPQITRTVALALFILLAVTTVILLYVYTEQAQKMNEYESSLVAQGDKLSYTLEQLERQRADTTSITYTEFSKKEAQRAQEDAYKTFGYITVPEGNYEVIDRRSFMYKGVEGFVLHGCTYGAAVVTKSGPVICLDANILMVEWNGESVKVDAFVTSTLDTAFSLHQIAFSEGSYTLVTESMQDGATLLISIDELACIKGEGMCIGEWKMRYKVSLPDMSVSNIQLVEEGKEHSYINRLFRFEALMWNKEGSRALFTVPCAEGCPDEYLLGVNMDTQKVVELVSGRHDADFNEGTLLDVLKYNWIDEDTVVVDGKEFTF